MTLKTVTFDPANADTDGIAANLVITGGDPDGIAANLTTAGQGSGIEWNSVDDAEWVATSVHSGYAGGRYLSATVAADETTPQSTLTIIGTDPDGNAITEDLILPASGAVQGTKLFLTVTGATADVAITGVLDIGWEVRNWSLANDTEFLVAVAGDGLAHRLGITTAANETTATNLATLTGTDADDRVISESGIVLPSSSVIETAKYFKTVTAMTCTEIALDIFDIGWVDEFVSPTIVLDEQFQSNWQIDVTGTISIDTDWMVKNPVKPALIAQDAQPWLDGSGVQAALDAETADSTIAVVVLEGYAAMRFRVNSYTDTAEFKAHFSQRSPLPPT